MKNKLQMICLFLLVALSLQAQRFVCSPLSETNKQTIYTLSGCRDVSAPVVSLGVHSLTVSSVGGAGTYSSTLYTPFSTESPAPLVAVDNDGMVNLRKGPGLTDPGRDNTLLPIGDAWSLLLFAALAAVGIFLRQQRRNTLAQNTKDTTHNA